MSRRRLNKTSGIKRTRPWEGTMTKLGYVAAIRDAVAAHGDRPSTIYGERRRTWSETLDRVSRVAGGLRNLGVVPGDRVAVLSTNTDVYLELYLAIPWAGGVVLPLNTRWTPTENAFALTESEPRVIVVGEGVEPSTIEALAFTSDLKKVWAGSGPAPAGWIEFETLVGSDPVSDAGRCGADLMAIFYTGGTTGRSKGVMLSHDGLVGNAITVRNLGMFPDLCAGLTVPPLFHLAAVTMSTCNMLAAGAVTVMSKFDPSETLRVIEHAGITDALLVPTMLQMMLDAPTFTPAALAGLKRVLYGASPISEGTLDRMLQAAPHTEFFQAYGMTETSCCATILEPRYHRSEHRTAGRHRAAGHPLRGTQVKIIDAAGQDAPVGTVGEVIVKGPGVMLGYWRQPELTASTVKDGWMHTGDGGYFDGQGLLYIADRLKDMIVTGAENVYSGEVESALSLHPAILQCAVIGVKDERWVERVHAVVVLRGGALLRQEDVIAHCRSLIADYKCPKTVEFRDGSLPISAQGKIQKTVLRAEYESALAATQAMAG